MIKEIINFIKPKSYIDRVGNRIYNNNYVYNIFTHEVYIVKFCKGCDIPYGMSQDEKEYVSLTNKRNFIKI